MWLRQIRQVRVATAFAQGDGDWQSNDTENRCKSLAWPVPSGAAKPEKYDAHGKQDEKSAAEEDSMSVDEL